MKTCPKCGTKNLNTAQFCTCGKFLSPPELSELAPKQADQLVSSLAEGFGDSLAEISRLPPIHFLVNDENPERLVVRITGALNNSVGIAAEFKFVEDMFGPKGVGWTLLKRNVSKTVNQIIETFEISTEKEGPKLIAFDITEFYAKGEQSEIVATSLLLSTTLRRGRLKTTKTILERAEVDSTPPHENSKVLRLESNGNGAAKLNPTGTQHGKQETETRTPVTEELIRISAKSEIEACEKIHMHLAPHFDQGWVAVKGFALIDGWKNQYVLKRGTDTRVLDFDLRTSLPFFTSTLNFTLTSMTVCGPKFEDGIAAWKRIDAELKQADADSKKSSWFSKGCLVWVVGAVIYVLWQIFTQ